MYNEHAILSDIDSNDTCDYETVGLERFLLIVVLGTPFALLGIIFNTFLFAVLCRQHHLKTPNLYFALLGFLDIIICLCYLFLMTVDAISVYFKNISLYSFYMQYSIPIFAMGRVVQLFSVYLVVAATIERFFIVRNWSSPKSRGVLKPVLRSIVVTSTLIICICLRVPVFFEYKIRMNPRCDDPFGAYQFTPILAAVDAYSWFSFYIMNVVSVFAPFTLLTLLNLSIIKTLSRRLSLAKKFFFPVRYISESTFVKVTSREKLKSATYMLVAIVTGYLISNVPSTIITILEYAAGDVLVDERGRSVLWYTLLTDISSILAVINSCLRLLLYCWCCRIFRHEALSYLRYSPYGTPLLEK